MKGQQNVVVCSVSCFGNLLSVPPIAIRLDANRFGGSDQASQPNRLSDHPTDLPFKFDMSESEDEQSSKNRKVIKTEIMKEIRTDRIQ